AAGHGTRRDRQAQKFPGGQQPFRRPIAGVLVQQDLQPHRSAQEALGDQLGRRRRRARLAARAAAGRLIAAAADRAAVGLGLDLHLLGVLGVAPLAPGLATVGTYLLGLGKFDEFLARGQMTVVAALGSFLRPRGRLRLGVGVVLAVEALQVVGAILAGLLLGFLTEELGVEACDLAAEVFVVLSDRVEAFEGAGVHALPVAGLLSQFEVVPAQRRYLGAQLGQFGPQQVEECVSFAGVRLDAALFEQESSHHARKVARPAQSGKDGKVTAGKRTG